MQGILNLFVGYYQPIGAHCMCCGKAHLAHVGPDLAAWFIIATGKCTSLTSELKEIPPGAQIEWGKGHPLSAGGVQGQNTPGQRYLYGVAPGTVSGGHTTFYTPVSDLDIITKRGLKALEDYGRARQGASAQSPSPLPHRCLTCRNTNLDSRDLEVNPATGNIWGCNRCGSKKLEAQAEAGVDLCRDVLCPKCLIGGDRISISLSPLSGGYHCEYCDINFRLMPF